MTSSSVLSKHMSPPYFYLRPLIAADPAIHGASEALKRAGGRVYAVGGAVRDVMVGEQPKDIDLLVSGLAEAEVRRVLKSLSGSVDLTGKQFGVFCYRHRGSEVHVALPRRRERSTGPAHQDFAVEVNQSVAIEEDLYRRDFTPNAMAVDLTTARLIDPFGGARDIESGMFRTLSEQSLSDDPLRTLRALVLHGRLGLEPNDQTREQLRAYADRIPHLSVERVQGELDKIFASAHPERAIRLAAETGVLKYVLPEVDAAIGYDQNSPHHELELGDHLINVLARAAECSDDPDLRLAALLHDIGKPGSAWVDPETGSNHFYEKHNDDGTVSGADHAIIGAAMAENLMGRLRYPTDRIERVRELVENHMYAHFTTTKGARRFLNSVEEHADDLLTLRWADQGGKSVYPGDHTKSLDRERELIAEVRAAGEPTATADLVIDGNDILGLGIEQGPLVGQILQSLTLAVIDNPELNNRDDLLKLAAGWIYLSRLFSADA